MKRSLRLVLRLCVAALVVVAVPASGRAAGGAHLAIHTIPVGIAPDALVLDAPAHRLFVANTGPAVLDTTGYTNQAPARAYHNGPGSVSVIDTQSDRVVATIPIDVWPLDMVLDTVRQRLYVLCDDTVPVRTAPHGVPTHVKPTLDIINARTLRLLTRRTLGGVLPLDPSLPFYPLHLLTLDAASNHLLVQAYDQYGGAATTLVAYLYGLAPWRLLRTYPSSPQGDPLPFAAQSSGIPMLVYDRFLPSSKPVPPNPTIVQSGPAAKLVARLALIQLASGVANNLRQVVLFDPWGAPLPYFGAGLSAEIRDIYITSALSRLLLLTAYSADYQVVAGPPYTLGIYDLQAGTLLRQLVFASSAPGGQQAVAFDEGLDRYYALGTPPNPKHPSACAPVNDVVIGDLRSGKVVQFTPSKGLLTVLLADPVRHLVYAATGNGGPDPFCASPLAGPPKPGMVQVLDGRTGAPLAMATLPSYKVTPSAGMPASRLPGQASAMTLDPSTGTVYAVDGRGGNAVYVISLARS